MTKASSVLVKVAVFALCSGAVMAHAQMTWIGTWTSNPTGLPTTEKMGSYAIPASILVKGTMRYRLRVSQGGDQVRLKLSNEYGRTPLALAAVTVGIAGDGLDARPGSLKKALFDGKPNVVIPAGAPVLTDPVDLSIKSLSDLVVSVYVPEGISVTPWATEASALDPGLAVDTDASLLERFSFRKRVWSRPIVSAVNVLTDRRPKVVVTLGDSITDGSTDPATGERGWPGALSRRLQEQNVSVVNAGIGGNRLLQSMEFMGRSALSRLEQDVFSVPGITHILVLEGINDIGMSGKGGMFGDFPVVRSDELITAYFQIITRAHERGIKVIGATIMPFEGADYFSKEKEKVRTDINGWIRFSGSFDGVIDFDAALRDPEQISKLKPEYDPGDHLHPNHAGCRHMGDVIDPKLFK